MAKNKTEDPTSEGLDDFSFLSEDTSIKSSEIIDDLLSGVPNSEGYYLKLYKEMPSGKWELKDRITEYDTWIDLEYEVKKLVVGKTKKNRDKWGSGNYKVMVFREGRPGFVKRPVNFSVDAEESSEMLDRQGNVADKISEMGELFKHFKEVMQPNSSNNNNQDMSKMLAETFKAGIDTIKDSIPKPEKPESSMATMLAMFKEMGLVGQKKEDNSSLQMMTTMLAMFKEMGLFNKQEQKSDVMSEIIKLKELGIIKMASDEPKEDAFAQIEKIKTLINVMSPLMGGGGNGVETPSLGLELVRTIGPAVPRIVENITDTVRSVAEVSKLKLSQRMNIPTPSTPPSNINMDPYRESSKIDTPYVQQEELAPPQPPPQPPSKQETTNMRNPLIQDIYDAVKTENYEFFPKLKDLINIYIGGSVMDKLVDREITILNFLQTMNSYMKEEFFVEEKTVQYFNKFLAWHIEETQKNIVIAHCSSCQEQYDYLSRDEFNADTKKCDCGGTIEEVSVHTNGGIA